MIARQQHQGFSLIELLIAVAIVGIIAAIAFPAYTNSVQNSRRSEAKAALLAAATQMERYFTERNTYATATLGPPPGVYPSATEHGYYTLTLTNLSATDFTLNAIPAAIQADDLCGTLSYTAQGTKTVTGSRSVSQCW